MKTRLYQQVECLLLDVGLSQLDLKKQALSLDLLQQVAIVTEGLYGERASLEELLDILFSENLDICEWELFALDYLDKTGDSDRYEWMRSYRPGTKIYKNGGPLRFLIRKADDQNYPIF